MTKKFSCFLANCLVCFLNTVVRVLTLSIYLHDLACYCKCHRQPHCVRWTRAQHQLYLPNRVHNTATFLFCSVVSMRTFPMVLQLHCMPPRVRCTSSEHKNRLLYGIVLYWSFIKEKKRSSSRPRGRLLGQEFRIDQL